MFSTLPISPFLFSRKAHLKPSTTLQNLIVTNKARPFDSENTMQLRVVEASGCAGGRQLVVAGQGGAAARVLLLPFLLKIV
ncbi:hypothetical protein E1A91_A04G139900v1 [Gossypium mustelinum]|uniref:Uncharacterized protein n=1 Tax=Gossypium mustelinum TaxID=34275 RepID=A0A5D2ZRZ9_GOSMU|nr:hypothetical protein E1A91_A04G139900v1 [Gossypium mustelinum]